MISLRIRWLTFRLRAALMLLRAARAWEAACKVQQEDQRGT